MSTIPVPLRAGYLWRRYEMGVPVCMPAWPMSPKFRGYVLWPAVDTGQLPALNRWDRLAGAFAGFVASSWGEPRACAYDLQAVLRLLQNEVVGRVWIPGADAAEVVEYLFGNLLGVWMGEKTPFMLSSAETLDEEVSRFFKKSF
jgi:hypothetical protein